MADLPGEAFDASRKNGCLRLAAAAPFLVVFAPVIAMLRSFARWRRGTERFVRIREKVVFETASGSMLRLSAEVDFPSGQEMCRPLTTAMAELASRQGRSLHHYLLHTEAGSPETVILPLGPSVQDLAERFQMMCRRSSVENRTMLWPALDPKYYIGEFLDPTGYDPDADGEPEGLLGRMPLEWALVLRRRRSSVSTLFSIEIIVPPEKEESSRAFFRVLGGKTGTDEESA